MWRAYEFPCKPGDPLRRPCVISPYHYRLDWQIWFAAMSTIDREPWLVHLVAKLLRGDADVKPLLARRPVPRRAAALHPRRRSSLRVHAPGRRRPGWWRRTRVGDYLRPLSLDDPALARAGC